MDEKELDDYNSDEVYEDEELAIQEPGFKMYDSSGVEVQYGSISGMLEYLRNPNSDDELLANDSGPLHNSERNITIKADQFSPKMSKAITQTRQSEQL